jgi:hypothetical protein
MGSILIKSSFTCRASIPAPHLISASPALTMKPDVRDYPAIAQPAVSVRYQVHAREQSAGELFEDQ